MLRKAQERVFQAKKCPESSETEVVQEQPNGQSPFKDVKVLTLGQDKRSQLSKPEEGASIAMMESHFILNPLLILF